MAAVCPHAAAAGATGAARPARRARRRSLCRQCDASAGGKALGPDAHTPRVACGFPAGGIVVALCGRGGCEGGVGGGPRRLLVLFLYFASVRSVTGTICVAAPSRLGGAAATSSLLTSQQAGVARGRGVRGRSAALPPNSTPRARSGCTRCRLVRGGGRTAGRTAALRAASLRFPLGGTLPPLPPAGGGTRPRAPLRGGRDATHA